MPVPMEVLLRTQTSRVPTQTLDGCAWSTAMAPIDCVYLSKMGLNVVPPFVDFHTPPPAAPTYIVLGSLATPSMAAILPLVTAGPMGRASIAPNVAESTLTSAERHPASRQAPNS